MEARPNIVVERLPSYIDPIWIEAFNERYANEEALERYRATVEAEDWLVQTEETPGSAYYELEDKMSSPDRGWRQTIRGKVWNAGVTHTPQYVGMPTNVAPVIALTEACLVSSDGSEEPIETKGLVLVRLDKLTTDTVELEPIAA